MFFYNALTNVFIMGGLCYVFHNILKKFDIEKNIFEKYSVNLMRSLICATISHEAYLNYNYVWLDKCLDNQKILNKFVNFHNMFLIYFIFDTVVLYYQIYKGIEKKIRIDLLFHHLLALVALTVIDYNKMYGITIMIGLSEGMSLASGPKLLSMYLGNKNFVNFCIAYRLIYLIFVRMLFIWPSLLYFYYKITNDCEKYKEQKNIFLVLSLIITIIHAEIKWLHSGRKELARI